MPKIVDREAKKKALARSAAIALATHGYGTVTLTHMAREAGCTTGTLGYYFDGKDDLVAAALRVTFDRLEERLDKDRDGKEGFLAIIEEILPIDELRRLECRMWVNFWAHASYSDSLRALNAELSTSWSSLLTESLRHSLPKLDSMSKRRVQTLAATTLSLVHGLIVQSVVQPTTFDLAYIREILSQYIEDLKASHRNAA
jgi:AcrR family transcriptional regulator